MMISPELRTAIKLSRIPAYRFAQVAGVHPSTLSQWMNGILPVKDGDDRVLKLAELLGVAAEHAFSPEVEPLESAIGIGRTVLGR